MGLQDIRHQPVRFQSFRFVVLAFALSFSAVAVAKRFFSFLLWPRVLAILDFMSCHGWWVHRSGALV